MSDIKEILIDSIFTDIEKRNDVIKFYEEYMGVSLSIPQLLENLSFMDNRTLLEIIEDGYTDTYVRGDILNFHSNMLIGKDWPINGDCIEIKDYFRYKLDTVYDEKGYKKVINNV